MRWIAVHCHRLALDATLRGRAEAPAVAICDRLQVLHASDTALAAGVRPGQRRATAQSLAAGLTLIEHDPRLERAALEQVAGWLLQFTPATSLQPPEGVLLEVEASLRLFGGLGRLLARIREGLAELGFAVRLADAPTAAAAWLLARWTDGASIAHESLLGAGLAPLPVDLVASAAPHRDALAAIGVRRVGDLTRLPRAGLARRYGPALLAELDAALGRQAEPRAWFVAPPVFAARIELLAGVEHAEALLFAARRLLLELAGWLGARQAATREALLTGEHEGGRHARPPTRIELRLAQPSRDAERLVAVLRERLAAVRLPAPVHGLRLDCTRVAALPHRAGDLFPVADGDPEGLSRLIERLQARLGREHVQRLLLASSRSTAPGAAPTRRCPACRGRCGCCPNRGPWPSGSSAPGGTGR
jgi:protein ImuB